MDDISRELPPDETGATPVSERQKGPEELQRFELGSFGEDTEVGPTLGNRLAGMGVPFLAERFLAVNPDAHITDDDDSRSSGEGFDDGVGDERSEHVEASVEGHVDSGEIESGDADEPESAEESAAHVDHVDGEADEVPAEDLPVEADDSTDEAAESAPDGELHDGELEDGEPQEGDVASSEAEAAVAKEANTMELDSDEDLVDSELGEDGLPIVAELTDVAEVARMVYVLMMTSREGMTVLRLARACNTKQKLVEEGLELLQEQLRGIGLPVELTRVGDTVRWMSGASAFPYLQRLRGVKKLEKLSPAALETLAVIAYRQPVMRSEIEAIRGVKAGPMLRTLLQHKLVKVAGRADVPGRPLQYGTTQQFLERFGLASLQELPSVKEWKNLG